MQPRVIARLAPAGECQPARRPQRLAHIGKRKRRLGEKHHAEPRDQEIEACGIERIHGCIGEHEIDRQARRRDLPGASQHRGRDVDAEHMSGRADFLRERDCRGAAAATDIDDPLAGFGLGAVDQYVGDRRKQDVLTPAGDRPSAGLPVRSSMRSGRRFDRGLSELPCAQLRHIFCQVIASQVLARSSLRLLKYAQADVAEARSVEGW